jgi:branched-chain amino acid transport system permease protein
MKPGGLRHLLWFALASVIGLAMIIVPLFLAGTPNADAEQARLCRMLLPALYPEEEGIRVILSEAGTRSSVHITFRTALDAQEHLLSCRFGGIGYSAAKRDLAAIQVDGVGMGEAAFYFLKERWLETQDAVLADPGIARSGKAALHLSRPMAVALQHILNGLPRSGILALLALATALIYGLIGRINLAFGEFTALGGIAASLIVVGLVTLGVTAPLVAGLAALVGALALAALYGRMMGRVILWPLSKGRGERASGQPLLVAGVGLLVGVQESLRLAQGAGTVSMSSPIRACSPWWRSIGPRSSSRCS